MGRWLGRVRGTAPEPERLREESPRPSVGSVSSVSGGTGNNGRWLKRVNTSEEKYKEELTEPTKAPSVGFVSSVSGGTPKTISVRRAIIRACMGQGITPGSLARGLSDADIDDIKQGRITVDDLREYAAFLVRNGCYWVREQPPGNETPEQTTPPPPTPEPGRVPGLWDQEGRAARDAYINHLMGCAKCYAPRRRFCPEGLELKGAYELAAAGRRAGAGSKL